MNSNLASKVAFCMHFDRAAVTEVKNGQLALVTFTANTHTYRVVYDMKRRRVVSAYTGQNQVLKLTYAERSMLTNRMSVELEAQKTYFKGMSVCKCCDGYHFNGNCRCA